MNAHQPELDEIDRPIRLLGREAVGAALSIEGHRVETQAALRLGLAGLLGQPYDGGRGLLYCPKAVKALAAWPLVRAPAEPATVLRVGPAVRSDDPDNRPWVGWHQKLWETQTQQKNAIAGVDRWWQIRTVEPGRLLVVTVSGFVVLVARITGHEHWQSLKHLHLDVDDRHPLNHTRLPTRAGGAVVEIEPS